MNAEQQQAYDWAKSHDYLSVAARYAKTLAGVVDSQQARITELEAQLAASQRREQAAVALIAEVERAVEVAFNATEYVRPNTGIWHTLGLALDWIKGWRGPREAGKGKTKCD